jgi:hypothetical protein
MWINPSDICLHSRNFQPYWGFSMDEAPGQIRYRHLQGDELFLQRTSPTSVDIRSQCPY